jgi:hypothetical protein
MVRTLTIRKRTASTRRESKTNRVVWKVLRTREGWVHLAEADAHLKELDRGHGTSVTILDTPERKLVLHQGNVCALSEFRPTDRKYDDETLHLVRVSLVRREVLAGS